MYIPRLAFNLTSLILATLLTFSVAQAQTETATGTMALNSDQNSNHNNTADGYFSLYSNTTGTVNTAVG